MRAGAVAKEGIAVNIGAKSIEIRNRTAVVSAVRPVLPPAATPAEDSTNVVVVDVCIKQINKKERKNNNNEIENSHVAEINIKALTEGFSEL